MENVEAAWTGNYANHFLFFVYQILLRSLFLFTVFVHRSQQSFLLPLSDGLPSQERPEERDVRLEKQQNRHTQIPNI